MYKLPVFLSQMMLTLLFSVALVTPSIAQDNVERDHCVGLQGKAFGQCNRYCKAKKCHLETHNGSKNSCDKALDKFINITGTVPPCETCGGPTGSTRCGNLAIEPTLDSDGPLNIAIIHQQKQDVALLWAVHRVAKKRGLGKVTQLSVADVVTGALQNTDYDVIIIGRLYAYQAGKGTDKTEIPLAFRDEIDLALQKGTGVMTEWQGATALFNSSGLLPTFQMSPAWNWFSGSLHGAVSFDAVFHNVAPEHPIMQGISETFSSPKINSCYLMWDQPDPSLKVLATVERADGGTLPAILATQRHRGQVVMWLCDWSDVATIPPLTNEAGLDPIVDNFVAKAIEYASVPGCLPGTYGAECQLPASCAELLALAPESSDGTYTLDVDGDGSAEPADFFCDMTTDGGGWTRLLTWDRESDAATHTLASLQQVMTDEIGAGSTSLSPMGVIQELPDSIQWGDNDFSYDVLSYRLDNPVNNNGELLLDTHYVGESMEKSGVWFYVDTAGTKSNALCYSTAESENNYSAAEKALIPYACPLNTGNGLVVNEAKQSAYAAPIAAFTLRSLHADTQLKDISKLYRLSVSIR